MRKGDCLKPQRGASPRPGGWDVATRRLLAATIIPVCLAVSALTAQTGGGARDAATDSLRRDLLRVVKAEMEYSKQHGRFASDVDLLTQIITDSIMHDAFFELDGEKASYAYENPDLSVVLEPGTDSVTGQNILRIAVSRPDSAGGRIRCEVVIDQAMNGTALQCASAPPR